MLHYSTEDIHLLATQAELLVLTSSLHPSEEGEEEAVRRDSQPYLPPPEVVTARAERIVWQRSLPRDFEFSPGLDDEPVEFEDLKEHDDVEVVTVDGDEVGDGEEEEEE